jgi:hypothetical protein
MQQKGADMKAFIVCSTLQAVMVVLALHYILSSVVPIVMASGGLANQPSTLLRPQLRLLSHRVLFILTGKEVIYMAASNSGSVGRGKAFDRPP